MKSLDNFFGEIDELLKSDKFKNCSLPVYRGHSKDKYALLPSLHRSAVKNGNEIWKLENNLYCDFRSLAGPSVSFTSSWDALMVMRHEGVPTRLLDWTEGLGTALYFALSAEETDRPHIWVLNPFKLNENDSRSMGTLLNPAEDMEEYSSTYANFCNTPIKDLHNYPIAIYPHRSNERLFAQRGLFTIHGIDERSMEETCGHAMERIDIPEELIEKLRSLIKYFGINDYSVYPDFKGLSTYLKKTFKY